MRRLTGAYNAKPSRSQHKGTPTNAIVQGSWIKGLVHPQAYKLKPQGRPGVRSGERFQTNLAVYYVRDLISAKTSLLTHKSPIPPPQKPAELTVQMASLQVEILYALIWLIELHVYVAWPAFLVFGTCESLARHYAGSGPRFGRRRQDRRFWTLLALGGVLWVAAASGIMGSWFLKSHRGREWNS